MQNNLRLASRLRRRVIIEQPVLTADGIGGYVQSWDEFATVWAEIQPRRGSERLRNEQLAATKAIFVIIRYLAGVTPQMRIIFGARIFNILTVLNPHEENILLEITAEEEV